MKKELFNPFFLISFIAIQLYLFILVFIPFLVLDKVQSWDSAGHLFAAWFDKTYLFPNYTGWNPFFYAGYPQDTYYPPLYHYLIVLLGFVVGLSMALKLICVVSVFILPLTFYYFARKFDFSIEESSVIMLFMMIPIITFNIDTGGTLGSTFRVGLGSNAIAFPLYFIYLAKLKIFQGRKDVPVLTLLLTAIILSHFVVTAVAFATVGVFILMAFMASDWDRFKDLIEHTGLSLLTTAFFLVPLACYIKYYGGEAVTIELTRFISFPVLFVMVMGFCAAVLEKEGRLLYSAIIVLLLVFMGLSFSNFSDYGIPFHAYRLVIYYVLFAMIFPYKIFFNKFGQWPKLILMIASLVFLGIYSYQILNPVDMPGLVAMAENRFYIYEDKNREYADLNIGKLSGRVIVYDGDERPHMHDLKHLIASNSRNYLLKGLFVESSVNGRYVHSLELNAVRNGFIFGVMSVPMDKDQMLTFDPVVLQKNLDLFNTNYLLINASRQIKPERLIKIQKGQDPYYLYRIGNSKLIELLNYKVQPVPESLWNNKVREWYGSESQKIFAMGYTLPEYQAGKNDRLSVISMNEQQTDIKLKVDSPHPVPIFIKISYFPRWRAYVNGKETKIYTALPYFMLVYGSGNVELKYENSIIDVVGWLLTIAGILLLFFLWTFKV